MRHGRLKMGLMVVTLLLLTGPLLAQDRGESDREVQTLFGSEVTHGGFGGPVVKFDDMRGDLGVWIGGRGGWIVNLDPSHALSLGGGGYALATEHLAPLSQTNQIDEDLFALVAYGGFELEYINRSYQLLHMTASTLIGGGGLLLRDNDFEDVDDSPDTFFVLEPGAQLELNVTTFFRIGAGVGYRWTQGISRGGFSDSDFSGFNGRVTLKFGKFR